jgi:polyribonucleotide nucleotidyltransferase
MAWERTNAVTDVVKLGDEVKVKLFEIDSQGRMNLSIKRTTEPPEGYVEPERKPRGDRKPGGNNRDRDRRNNNHRR